MEAYDRRQMNIAGYLLRGLLLSLTVLFLTGMHTQAATRNPLEDFGGGIALVMEPCASNAAKALAATAEELNLEALLEEEEESTLFMVNVKNAMNVRSEPSEDAEKVGKLYKDCGGTILEYGDGWTKIQSGNLIGWACNDYLLFGEEAQALAEEVGITYATVTTETLRVRYGAGTDSGIMGLLPKGEVVEVIDDDDEEWICIDYEGADGYVSAEYVEITFQIDAGETLEEIEAREAAEAKAKLEASRNVKYGAYTADADTTLLLAALIQCEAGGESYEGMLAVGAVVMNRVRSSSYPNTVYSVIYASGQFTPALNGKVDALYASGNIKQSCIDAATAAINGTSNIGSATHFRRNDGRDGIVIGNHVFY